MLRREEPNIQRFTIDDETLRAKWRAIVSAGCLEPVVYADRRWFIAGHEASYSPYLTETFDLVPDYSDHGEGSVLVTY